MGERNCHKWTGQNTLGRRPGNKARQECGRLWGSYFVPNNTFFLGPKNPLVANFVMTVFGPGTYFDN